MPASDRKGRVATEIGAEQAPAHESRVRQLQDTVVRLEARLAEATDELGKVRGSDAYRFGETVLVRWRLGGIYRFLTALAARIAYRWRLLSLSFESRFLHRGRRLMASICGNFPIYSQTFVYQELIQLQAHGFEVRHAYSFALPRSDLHQTFAALWSRRRLLVHDYDRHRSDYEHYRARFPERVQTLVDRVAQASGMPKDKLVQHHDFLRGFTYTRMVEAWRPQWLHSYFFYERSLYSLIAGQVLGIPRGVSSYADHLLHDYELKVVPLHLELCDVVVATSARIKQELLSLAPGIDPDKIVVKPNAIDSEHFPFVERHQPGAGQPWRLTCVARLEPKKGLLHLVEAMRILVRDRGRKVELHLIGEADRGDAVSQAYGKRLREYCQQHELGGTVHFEGRQPQQEVRRFLTGSQLFVAPFVETETGDKDGIPTALLEAMATGAACVVTDAGSMLEVVTHDVDGVVVGQRDAMALADAIESLLLDPDRRRALGKAAAATVAKQFDVRVCESRLHQRIDAVLARSARR